MYLCWYGSRFPLVLLTANEETIMEFEGESIRVFSYTVLVGRQNGRRARNNSMNTYYITARSLKFRFLSPAFEKLYFAFVLLRRLAAGKCSQVSAAPRTGFFLS